MPNHEMGQRRAVLGLDAIRVRVAVARLDMQARRGVQRDKLEFGRTTKGLSKTLNRKHV